MIRIALGLCLFPIANGASTFYRERTKLTNPTFYRERSNLRRLANPTSSMHEKQVKENQLHQQQQQRVQQKHEEELYHQEQQRLRKQWESTNRPKGAHPDTPRPETEYSLVRYENLRRARNTMLDKRTAGHADFDSRAMIMNEPLVMEMTKGGGLYHKFPKSESSQGHLPFVPSSFRRRNSRVVEKERVIRNKEEMELKRWPEEHEWQELSIKNIKRKDDEYKYNHPTNSPNDELIRPTTIPIAEKLNEKLEPPPPVYLNQPSRMDHDFVPDSPNLDRIRVYESPIESHYPAYQESLMNSADGWNHNGPITIKISPQKNRANSDSSVHIFSDVEFMPANHSKDQEFEFSLGNRIQSDMNDEVFRLSSRSDSDSDWTGGGYRSSSDQEAMRGEWYKGQESKGSSMSLLSFLDSPNKAKRVNRQIMRRGNDRSNSSSDSSGFPINKVGTRSWSERRLQERQSGRFRERGNMKRRNLDKFSD